MDTLKHFPTSLWATATNSLASASGNIFKCLSLLFLNLYFYNMVICCIIIIIIIIIRLL